MTARKNPFRGLEPFEESQNLYGRDSDLILLKDRLYSRRTTLLFSASGAGKTSFLRAKVMPEFRSSYHCCMHNKWAGEDPKSALLEHIADIMASEPASDDNTLTEYLSKLFPPVKKEPERDKAGMQSHSAMEESFSLVQQEQQLTTDPVMYPKAFLLILDQFEEFFQAHAFREDFEPFIKELCGVINAMNLRIRVIISMRDDFLGELGIFDNRIPDLFNNYYHLKNPDEIQAQEIIRRTVSECPLASFHKDQLKILVEQLSKFGRFMLPSESESVIPQKRMWPRTIRDWPKFIASFAADCWKSLGKIIADKLAIWRTWLNRNPFTSWMGDLWNNFTNQPLTRWFFRRVNGIGRWLIGPPPTPKIQQVKRHTVLLPYLQIVCRELWSREHTGEGNHFTFLGTWDSERQSAQDILNDFCIRTLDQFSSERQKNLASRAFDYLMTREGAKQAYEYKTLAQHMDVDPEDLRDVLRPLEDSHILRGYNRLGGSYWYELYHDMYAVIVQQWKNMHLSRRARKRRIVLGMAAVLVIFASYVTASLIHYVKYSSRIEAATDTPPMDAYQKLHQIYLFRIFAPGLAEDLLSSYWDRRAALSGIQEDAGRALFFSLNGLEVEPGNSQRQARVQHLVEAYQGLKKTFQSREGANVSALAISPERLWVAVGNIDGFVQVRKNDSEQALLSRRIGDCNPAGTETEVTETQPDPIRDLLFSADEKWVAVRSASGLAQTWNLDDIKQCSQVWHDTIHMAFGTSGHDPGHIILVAFSNGLIQSWVGKTPAWGTTYYSSKQQKPVKAVRPMPSSTPAPRRLAMQPLPPITGKLHVRKDPYLQNNADEGTTINSIVFACRLSPNMPDHIFAVDAQNNVLEWRHDNKTPSNSTAQFLLHNSEIQPVFDSTGTRMIAMRGGVLELWDLVKLREIKQLKNKFDIKNIISFSPDGRTFAVYSAGQIHLYDSKSGTESSLISAAQFPANADLRLLQNQTFLVIPSSVTTPSANTDTKLQYPIIWDPNKNKVTTPLPEAASIFAISRNSLNMITSSGTDYARLWRLDQRIIDQKDMFDKILLGFNAHIAALQSDDGAIAVQDMQLGTKVVRLNGSNSLHLTALTKNGALLAAVNGKTQLELYFGDKIIYSKDFSQNIDSVQFSPDDRILLVQYGVSSWRMIKIAEHYDITDDAKPSVEEPHPTKTVSSAVSLAEFSPDSKVLLLIKSGTIYLIRCDDNLLIASFPVKGDMPARYAFSPDTSKLVLFDGKQIQTIDWQNGKRATVDGSDANAPQFLVFQPGGKQFLAILPDKSQLWNFNNSTPPKDFPTLPNSSAAYFIPESTETTNHHFGYMLTLDSENRTLQIWDVGSGDKKGPDFKLASPIYGRLQFIPNTQQIIVPSHSGWIYKLKITSEGLIPGDSQIRVGMPTSPVNGILVTRQIFVSVVSFGLGQRISMTDFSNNPNVSEISKLDELKDKGSALAKAFLVDEGRYTIH